MARRGHAARRATRGKSNIWDPTKDPALFSLMRGDDPGILINTTPEPHQYRSIPGRGSLGKDYDQAVSGSQPQVSSDWTPGPVPFFTSGRLLSIGDVSDTKFLHTNTSKYKAHGVFLLPNVASGSLQLIWGTFGIGASGVGAALYVNGTGTLTFRIGNGSGSTFAVNAALLALSNDSIYTWSIEKDETSVNIRVNGSAVHSGSLGTTDNDASAAFPLALGATSTGGSSMTGFQPEFLIFSGENLPDSETVEGYLQRWSYTP